MTEDDTFRALSRPSVTEMKRIYQQWMRGMTPLQWTVGDRRELFNSNGWGVQEFVDEMKKLKEKLPHD